MCASLQLMSSKAVRREGRADVKLHDVGDFPGVQELCRAEQACRIWLLKSGYHHHHQHRHGQYKTTYCGRAAPAVATLMLAFAIRVLGHLLTDGMNP